VLNILQILDSFKGGRSSSGGKIIFKRLLLEERLSEMKFYKTVAVFVSIMNFYSVAYAVQIAGCHCFQNRQFDAAQPGAVDPYILATTQNSFLAAIFGIDKKQIVQTKMRKGASGDDLWIAYFTASKTDADTKELLASRKISSSWKKALEKSKIHFKLLGPYFKKALTDDISDKEFSNMIVDQMIINHFGSDKTGVKKLRIAGAQNKEIILSAFLSLYTKRSAQSFYTSVIKGQFTWGKILNDLKIEASDMGTEINKILKK
jgi:hypothetical protein